MKEFFRTKITSKFPSLVNRTNIFQKTWTSFRVCLPVIMVLIHISLRVRLIHLIIRFTTEIAPYSLSVGACNFSTSFIFHSYEFTFRASSLLSFFQGLIPFKLERLIFYAFLVWQHPILILHLLQFFFRGRFFCRDLYDIQHNDLPWFLPDKSSSFSFCNLHFYSQRN